MSEKDPLIYGSPNTDSTLNIVSTKITRYVTEVGSFEKMVHRYGSPSDTTEFRQQISAKRDELVHMYKVIVHDLRELKPVVNGMAKVKFDKMSEQFERTHKEYQIYSESSIQKDRVYHPIHVEPKSNPIKEYKQSHTPTSSHQSPFYQQDANLQIYEEEELVNKAVEERNREMARVAKEMQMLKEVYEDVNKLVVEQGIQLEQVHKNTEHADIRVEEGVKELRVAEKYTHSYRKKVICLSLLLLLILITVGLVLWKYLTS